MFGGKGCAIGETDAISGIITTSNHQHAVHGSRLVTHNNVVYDGRLLVGESGTTDLAEVLHPAHVKPGDFVYVFAGPGGHDYVFPFVIPRNSIPGQTVLKLSKDHKCYTVLAISSYKPLSLPIWFVQDKIYISIQTQGTQRRSLNELIPPPDYPPMPGRTYAMPPLPPQFFIAHQREMGNPPPADRDISSTRGEIGGDNERPNRRRKVSGNNRNTNNT